MAASLKADYLHDDKRAQKEAKLHQVNFIPTFAALLKATQKGFISDQVVLTELQQKNISRDLSLAAKSFLELN